MSFEKFSNTIKNALEEKIEKLPSGILRVGEGLKYEAEREIDNLHYVIRLERKNVDSKKVYSLGFETKEYNSKITNQGLSTYNKLITEIANVISEIKKYEDVNIIEFNAAKTSLSIEKAEEINDAIEKAYIKNENCLDGFSYKDEKTGDSISVSNGGSVTLIQKEMGTSLFDKTLKPIGEKQTRFTIKEVLFNNNISLLYSVNEKDELIAMLEFLKENEQLVSYFKNKKGDEQRMKLYERTLKNRFPDIRTEVKGDKVYLHLNSLPNNQ